jgi:hypothetical protein
MEYLHAKRTLATYNWILIKFRIGVPKHDDVRAGQFSVELTF